MNNRHEERMYVMKEVNKYLTNTFCLKIKLIVLFYLKAKQISGYLLR